MQLNKHKAIRRQAAQCNNPLTQTIIIVIMAVSPGSLKCSTTVTTQTPVNINSTPFPLTDGCSIGINKLLVLCYNDAGCIETSSSTYSNIYRYLEKFVDWK